MPSTYLVGDRVSTQVQFRHHRMLRQNYQQNLHLLVSELTILQFQFRFAATVCFTAFHSLIQLFIHVLMQLQIRCLTFLSPAIADSRHVVLTDATTKELIVALFATQP